MQKVSRFFQIFFKFLMIFFISFIWVRYFIKSLWQSFLISLAITILIDIISRIFTKKKNAHILLKSKEREKAENCFFSLCMDENNLEFLFKLASSRHCCKKLSKCILILHPESKIILFPYFNFLSLSQDDVVKIVNSVKTHNPTKIVILCHSILKETASFVKNFDIDVQLLDQYDAYQKLYKIYDVYPEIKYSYKKDKKLALKDLAMYSLNRSRAKGYFFSALILIFSSFFVRANLYYAIVASLLVILALISLYDPFSKNKINKELL